MKKQDGKTPLTWLIIIVVSLIIGGAIVAMLFEGADIIPDVKSLLKI